MPAGYEKMRDKFKNQLNYNLDIKDDEMIQLDYKWIVGDPMPELVGIKKVKKDDNVLDAGMGTTASTWQMLSDLLNGEKLPESLNKCLHELCDGNAKVVLKSDE